MNWFQRPPSSAAAASSASPCRTAASLDGGGGVAGATLSSCLQSFQQQRLRPLLDAADRLRSLSSGSESEADAPHLELEALPAVVVVGLQSAGKSSLLEALSGVALPRGAQITTRCPIVLRLVHDAACRQPHARVSLSLDAQAQSQGQLFYNLDGVGRHVAKLTEEVAGAQQGVSAQPIYVRVVGREYADLTLIDLPGLAHSPVGAQPANINAVLRELLLRYMRAPDALLVNVVQCGVDLAACEAIALSRQVDPEGRRTVVVVTKMDRADRDVCERVETARAQLDAAWQGLFGVRTRAQHEQELSWTALRARERAFFATTEPFARYRPGAAATALQLGTDALIRRLVELQTRGLRRAAPRIQRELRAQIDACKARLEALTPCFGAVDEMHVWLDRACAHYLQTLSQIGQGAVSVSGGSGCGARKHPVPRLMRRCRLFQEALQERVRACQPFACAYAQTVLDAIERYEGLQLPDLNGQVVMRALVEQQLLQPAREQLLPALVQDLERELLKTLLLPLRAQLGALQPALQIAQDAVQAFALARVALFGRRMREQLEAETELFTLDPYYLDLVRKLESEVRRLCARGEPQEQQQQQMQPQRKEPKRTDPTRLCVPWLQLSSRLVGFRGELQPAPAVCAALAPRTWKRALAYSDGEGEGRDDNDGRAKNPLFWLEANDLRVPLQTGAVRDLCAWTQRHDRAGAAAQVQSLHVRAFAYMHCAAARVADQAALLTRLHLVRCLTTAFGSHSLSLALHSAFDALGDEQYAAWLCSETQRAAHTARSELSNQVAELQELARRVEQC